jgi:hypothetical protein
LQSFHGHTADVMSIDLAPGPNPNTFVSGVWQYWNILSFFQKTFFLTIKAKYGPLWVKQKIVAAFQKSEIPEEKDTNWLPTCLKINVLWKCNRLQFCPRLATRWPSFGTCGPATTFSTSRVTSRTSTPSSIIRVETRLEQDQTIHPADSSTSEQVCKIHFKIIRWFSVSCFWHLIFLQPLLEQAFYVKNRRRF